MVFIQENALEHKVHLSERRKENRILFRNIDICTFRILFENIVSLLILKPESLHASLRYKSSAI